MVEWLFFKQTKLWNFKLSIANLRLPPKSIILLSCQTLELYPRPKKLQIWFEYQSWMGLILGWMRRTFAGWNFG